MTDLAEFTAILNEAQPDPNHSWMLPTKYVAEGFGVSPETIRAHKSNHKDELAEGHHWLQTHAGTLWSKAGVIRLGMFINSDRAKRFRDAAETYLVSAMESLKISTEGAIAQTVQTLERVADAIADEILTQQLTGLVEQRLNAKLSDRLTLERCLGKLGFPVPGNLPALLGSA